MHGNASLDDIASYLDDLLEAPKYETLEPDSNRLLYRAGAGVSKIAVAVNTSLSAVMGAAKGGAQLLIVHHPPWAEIERHLRDEKLAALAAAGVSLYAAHSSLDCAPKIGNGWVLASMLGVAVEQTFMPYHAGHAGVAGQCEERSFGDLIQRTSRELGVQVEAYQHAKTFGRVGIVTGGGGDTVDLDAARAVGCDTYVTGEGNLFTRIFAKECGVNLIFGTHQATEAPGIKALGQMVSDEAQIPWEFIGESPDVF